MGMMELYFEAPHGPLLDGSKKSHQFDLKYRWHYPKNTTESDLMWNHHHDQQGFDVQPSTSSEGDIFLYRNPLDALYSNTKRDETDRFEHHLGEYHKLFHKWVVGGLATTLIQYENMVANPEEEFKKIVDHFGKDWDVDKFREAYKKVTKKALVFIGGHRKDIAYPEMLTRPYEEGRLKFRQTHYGRAKQKLLDKSTEKWLAQYF